MTSPSVSPFMHAANIYLAGGPVTLEEAVAAFATLPRDAKRQQFGQLCRRELQINDQLIDLLLAISTLLPRQRPATFIHLEGDWRKRGKDTFPAEKMLILLKEQFDLT